MVMIREQVIPALEKVAAEFREAGSKDALVAKWEAKHHVGEAAASRPKSPLEEAEIKADLALFNASKWMNLAQMYEQQKDLERAYCAYKHVLDIRPDTDMACQRLVATGQTLNKSQTDIRKDIPPRAVKEPVLRRCPCCGKDVSDPSHIKAGDFVQMFASYILALRKLKGNASLNLKEKVILQDKDGRKVNIIHKYLKLDGSQGRPNVETFAQLLVLVGGKELTVKDSMSMFDKMIMWSGFLHGLNNANPTPEDMFDLTDIISVLRDDGWRLLENLRSAKANQCFDAQDHLAPDGVPEFDDPIYVDGKNRGQYSFPTYFCYNTHQARLVSWHNWAEFLRAMRDPLSFRFFSEGVRELSADNHHWGDLWWIIHQRLNSAHL
jgi:tetratricopeptide (TPR) repeat protein